ncbi:uncharacterized protein B0T15DRAFT_86228 [Chaetomium strumarium]|uniref:Peptidase S8/S53 domain-containing protein n=1 Tax=Chaetomium strumarium TaxID=1170767 RepID=A0AAJ0M3P0_9PEZI|nr:hypothetical protein B0T15DRAFT_86228 [Chaetomium strumarium]
MDYTKTQATGSSVDMEKDINDSWAKFQKKLDLSSSFGYLVNGLHRDLVSALKRASEQGVREEEASRQISRFLFPVDEEKRLDRKKDRYRNAAEDKSIMDDCVRWVILSAAVTPDSNDQEQNILDTILRERGYLAFENINHEPIKNSCRSKAHQDKSLKSEKSTIFHQAIRHRNAKAIEIILSRGKDFCDKVRTGTVPRRDGAFWPAEDAASPKLDLLLHVAGHKDKHANTALDILAEDIDEQYTFEALKTLLDKLPGLVEKADKLFETALENDKFEIAAKLLEPKEGQKLFATSKYIKKALAKVTPADEESSGNPRMKMVQDLLSHAGTEARFNIEVLGNLIHHGLMKTWDTIAKDVPEECQRRLLHLAVLRRNFEFARRFLKEYPKLAKEKVSFPEFHKSLDSTAIEEGFYPLWYNNKQWDEGKRGWVDCKGDKSIRSLIVHHTIRTEKKMQDLAITFQKSGEPAKDLCFDLSGFTSKRYQVSDLVESLTDDEKKLVEYEETLRYVELPPLDLNAEKWETFHENKYLAVEHREAFKILKWLRNKHQVQNIISLKVPDRLINPHDEWAIAAEVKKFKVENLDWRFLDMSIYVLEEGEVRDRIRELDLYASGKHAPIRHWLSSEGVQSLRNLRIHVIQEMGSEQFCEATVKRIKEEFEFLEPRVSVTVLAEFWNGRPKQPNLNELAQRVAPQLSQFIRSYRMLAHTRRQEDPNKGFMPIKVAIIDNGILSIAPKAQDKLRAASGVGKEQRPKSGSTKDQPNNQDNANRPAGKENSSSDWAEFFGDNSLSSRIELGCSFVGETAKLSPWSFASNPHGTQMANLICAIDPLCKLYVAKVADGMSGIKPERVARAIEWAISKGVDVISMSFTMLDSHDDLKTQMNIANTKNIVMVCSYHDEGSRVFEAWPAAHQSSSKMVIAACDKYGKLIRDVAENDKPLYDYKVEAVDVPAGAIPFLDSNDRISGSSVATALVAGLSSLILSCYRLAHPQLSANTRYQQQKMPIDIIKEHLDRMRNGPADKYLLLENFAKTKEQSKDGSILGPSDVFAELFGLKKQVRLGA